MKYISDNSDYDSYTQAYEQQYSDSSETGRTLKDVEIFRAGEHKPMNGQTFLFTGSMLNDVAISYNAKSNPAPVVVGHPKTDAPAYGWVSDIRIDGDKLVADFSDIDPQFADWIKTKRYRKISSSFYKPDALNSPSPGKWTLKHVGFLGAAAPAVSGLKDASFANGNVGVIAFGEDDLHDLPAEYIALFQRHENTIVIDNLVGKGRVLPIHRDQVIDFVNEMNNGDTISFSDGKESGKRDWFLNFISQFPQFVTYGSYDMSNACELDNISTNAPNGFSVDPDGIELQAKANALSKTEGISFEEAVQKLAG